MIWNMENRTKSLTQITGIPDGYYFGAQSAYYVEIIQKTKKGTIKSDPIKMNQGIRGVNLQCDVEVSDGWVYIND